MKLLFDRFERKRKKEEEEEKQAQLVNMIRLPANPIKKKKKKTTTTKLVSSGKQSGYVRRKTEMTPTAGSKSTPGKKGAS